MSTYSKKCSAVGGYSYASNFTLYIELTETSVSTSANTSKIKYKVYCQSSGSGSISAKHYKYFKLNGKTIIDETVNVSASSPNAYIKIAEGTTSAITHNSDGSKSVSFEAEIEASSYGVKASKSGTFNLSKIPRYTSITSFNVSKRSETSLNFNWGTADTIDYVWYSTNNGGTWVGYDVGDGTGGTFVVSGLSANTTYNCKLRVRRKDSQLTTDSGTYAQTTYKIPTQSFNSKTETTITMNYWIDDTPDHIWYSTNNGGSWIDGGGISATSGTFKITGLAPNTNYNVRLRIRRKATQTTYDIGATNITTYKVPTQSVNSKTETTITMNWGADSEVDYLWYTINNGASWVGINIPDGTSGTYTINNLSVNTTYQIKARVRRKATQTIYETAFISVSTYDYPYATTTPDFTIGNAVSIGLYNPLGRNLYITMLGADDSIIYEGDGWTGTSIGNFNNAEIIDKLYKSIPNSQNGQYKIIVKYSTISTKQKDGGTYKIVGNEKPIFTSNNIIDLVDTLETSITGDNTKFIQSHNTLNGKIVPMTAQKYASGVKYVIKLNGTPTSQEKAYSSSNINFSASNLNTNTITVTAYDSRNLSTTININIDMVSYLKPTITNLEITRRNGIDNYAIISGQGAYNNWNGLSVPNEVVILEYRWKSLEDDAEFSNWIDVSDGIVNAGDGTWTFTRTLDTEFSNTSAFKIEVRCKDLLEYCTNTKTGDLTTAIALIWRDLENLRFGIGKKPDYKLDVAGDINAEEDINTDTAYKLDSSTIISKENNLVTMLTDYFSASRNVKIPKNSTAGYGLCNNDGASIIRDWNNGCVTVDATGNDLFLGFQNTTSLNILNGKLTLDNNGNLNGTNIFKISKSSAEDTYFVAERTDTSKNIKFGIGTGGVNRGIYDITFNKWIFYADASHTYIQSNNSVVLNSGSGNLTLNSAGEVTMTKSVKIPKNGTDGYGICNTDGKSIIRDHNNSCVTVNATGGTLFLGYQNTTGLNILDGKININSAGTITSTINCTSGVYSSGNSIQVSSCDGSGKGCRMNSNGNLTVCGSVYGDYGSMRFKHIYDADVVTNATNLYITSSGWIRRTSKTSSKRYKKEIKLLQNEELNPNRLYELEVKQFKYKEAYQPNQTDKRYNKTLVGFIAEDLAELYPIAVDYEYDEDGSNPVIDNWNERYIIPPMLKLIQNQKKKIDELEDRIKILEER